MNDTTRRRVANLLAVLADAMTTIPGDVVATHRRLGETGGHDHDRPRPDGDGWWCETHERSLARCRAEGQDCTGIIDHADDPTGEAAVSEAGSMLAAQRRQERHDQWLAELLDLVDRGLREFGYGTARLATSQRERLIDAAGCPIDCCPHCWTHVSKAGKHWEKSIEGDRNAGRARDGRKVCGPCRDYETDFGHLPPLSVLQVMRSTRRRPVAAIIWRLDPDARAKVGA